MTAYPEYRSSREALEALKRKRLVTMFVLTNEAIEREHLVCRYCQQLITLEGWNGKQNWEGGNHHGHRAEYLPMAKQVRHMHYDCMWTGTFTEIAELGRVIA